MPDQTETLQTIHSLRSCHGNFSARQVSDEDLRTILQAAVRAANASAKQSYSIIVLDDKDAMREVTGYRASKALVFCVDYNRIVDTAKHLGRTYDAGNALALVSGLCDALLAAQTAAIAARSLGVDSLFTNGIFWRDTEQACRLLNLPDKYCFPAVELLLGYAEGEAVAPRGRLCGPGVVHFGKYSRLSGDGLEQLVREYDDPDQNLALDALEDWAEKGSAHYLEAFYLMMARFAAGPQKEICRRIVKCLDRSGFLPKAAKAKGKATAKPGRRGK